MLIKLNTHKIEKKDVILSVFARLCIILIFVEFYLYGYHAVFDKAELLQPFHDLAIISSILTSALVFFLICFILKFTFMSAQVLMGNAKDFKKILSVFLLFLLPIGELSFIFNLKGIKNATIYSYWQDKITDPFFDSSYLFYNAYDYRETNNYIIRELCELISGEQGFSASYNADNKSVFVKCSEQGASYLLGIGEMFICIFRNQEDVDSFEKPPTGWDVHTPLNSQIPVCKLDFTEKNTVDQIKRLIITAMKEWRPF